MLNIKNLTATTQEEPLLVGINLKIAKNEVHALTGPKFCGKSVLAHTITGHPGIKIESGSVMFGRRKLNDLPPNERVNLGIFISFQTPSDFDEITNWQLFQSMHKINTNNRTIMRGKYDKYCESLGLGSQHGDKEIVKSIMTASQFKRNEVLQLLMDDPKFIILDEIDEGLTEDEVVMIAILLRDYISEKNIPTLVISRNHTFLDILSPTHVHIMSDGEIRLSGGPGLYKRIIEDEHSEFSTST